VKELLVRFVIGGLVISAFSSLSDVLKPKSFAGLFGAAPSVALATLGLTVATEGATYAALEARSMIGGAIAMLVYAYLVMQVMSKYRPSALVATTTLLAAWLVTSFSLAVVVLR
jgi:Protein of unknown function (DUF3147)